MTFAAPLFLLGAGALSLLVVALHLLARRTPKPSPFPTARFVPVTETRALSMARRPTDLLLLLLRIAILMTAGVAFARPSFAPRRSVAHVVVLDYSRSVASVAEVLDSAGAYFESGDAVVAFTGDTAVILSSLRELDLQQGRKPGNLTAGIIGAVRAAASVRADSVELVLVSAFADEGWDAATDLVRQEWKGRARLIGVSAAPVRAAAVEFRSTPGDPLEATLALARLMDGEIGVRLVRDVPSADDSAWAASTGGALVVWPRDDMEGQGATDTVGAVIAGHAVAVAPFARSRSRFVGDPVAHWVDGTVAAAERTLGEGCQRDVRIPVPVRGDLVLREGWRALVRRLLTPCGGPQHVNTLSPSQLATLEGNGPLWSLARGTDGDRAAIPVNTVLLLLALAGFAGEPLLRRRWRNG